ncbi:hypothetical protein ACWF94_32120 [Streptomyces sp. NPDC055078]
MDAAAADVRRAERERARDERAARLRERERAERVRARAERAERRAARSGRLTAEFVYRRGTLALVVASGLASLPAQVLHFVHISAMLLPLPFALEGAAWVMAAGVAYADARHLPAWVRWLLRGLVAVCAGFAAFINYGYGLSLATGGLSEAEARTVGTGLAAVTLLGPVVFEIRQWVSTLAATEGGQDARDRRRHDRNRRRHHGKVARIAERLLSAAPYGSLSPENAWARAWQIHTGTDEYGMTPDLHRRAVKSAAALTAARTPIRNHDESTRIDINRSMSDLPESTPWPPVTGHTPIDPPALASDAADTQGAIRPAVAAAESTRPRRATGRVPVVARAPRSSRTRTPDQLLIEARTATADWPDAELTGEAIRKAVRTAPARARVLRDTLRAERATSDKSTAAG